MVEEEMIQNLGVINLALADMSANLLKQIEAKDEHAKGLVAINLSLTDQVSQLRDELAQYKTEIEQLREIVEKMQGVNTQWQCAHERLEQQNAKLATDASFYRCMFGKAKTQAEKLEAENKDFRETFVKAVQTSYDPVYVDEVLRQRDNLKKENHLLSEHAAKQTAKSTKLEAENVRLKENAQIAGQYFSSWKSIINVMDLLAPDWRQQKPLNQSDKVSSAIKDLADDAKKFRDLDLVKVYGTLDANGYITLMKGGKFFYE